MWPREGTQEARVAARDTAEGSSAGARQSTIGRKTAAGSPKGVAKRNQPGASESTFRSVAEQCGKVESEAISYPEEGNEACFELEDQSFWFRHRNDCIRELVRNFLPRGKGPIFDVGGGNGFVAKVLIEAGWEVVLVEPGPSGARNAKKRGLEHVVCGTTHSAGFKNGSLPAIGVFDVVEHIEDDLGFLRHLWDLLEPGGMLYLTVPAYNFLWSHEDVDAGHFRRYRLERGAGGMERGAGEEKRVGKNEPGGGIMQKLSHAGFKPVYGTYIFGFLPLPVFLFSNPALSPRNCSNCQCRQRGQAGSFAKAGAVGRDDGEKFRVGIEKNSGGENDSIWWELFGCGEENINSFGKVKSEP